MEKEKIGGLLNQKIKRRSFLKWSGAVAAPAVLGTSIGFTKLKEADKVYAESKDSAEKVYYTSNGNNCGGRCVIKAHVKNGQVVRISSQIKEEENGQPALKACVRGRNYRNMTYHPDRLKYPMKRVGKRGEGKFERISWDEAIETIASEMNRITKKYGPASRYSVYGWGNGYGVTSDIGIVNKLLALTGGYLSYRGNYSSFQTGVATPTIYGTGNSGNSYSSLAYSKVIILMAHNPGATVFGTTMRTYLMEARKNGAKIIVVDPRYSESAKGLADEWIPIKPTTDTALMDAMAYVIYTEGLHDQAFLDKYCIGFDEKTLPEGIDTKESIKAYLLGEKDGVKKTPEWAEKITGMDRNKIKYLARLYATNKPGALMLGNGGQRHAYGEQHPRGGAMLACMTGNVGVLGGWASAKGDCAGRPSGWLSRFSSVPNPVEASISCFTFTDAILRGTEMTAEDGLQGVDKLDSNIKMIFNFSGNALLNQHSDINRTKEILADESKAEFIVVNDIFMTPSAKYADILLPGTTFLERNDILNSWSDEGYVTVQQKVLEPLYECRDEYEVCAAIAKKLGVYDQFTEGKTRRQWMDDYVEAVHESVDPNFPSFDELCKKGVHFFPMDDITIAFEDFVKDPKANPLSTPTGKIELFSKTVWDMNQHDEIPAIPKYIPAWEGPEDPKTKKYPLQLIGWHFVRRCHSIHDNQPWLEEAEKQVMWMNPIDAKERNIKDADKVKVFNDRGTIFMPVHLTNKIVPGVIAIPQGAWHSADKNGNDVRGSLNVLTTSRPTAWAKANPQHTNLAQVEKA